MYRPCVFPAGFPPSARPAIFWAPLPLPFVNAPYFAMLFRDNKECFAEQVIERYEQLRQTYLSDEYLTSYVDETLEWLGPAVQRNYDRWKEAFGYQLLESKEGVGLADRNQYTTEEAASYLKEWLVARGAFMDEHIDVLNFYGHPSTYKKWEH